MPDGRKRVFDLIVENLLSGPGEAAAPEAVAAVTESASGALAAAIQKTIQIQQL